MQTKLLEIGGMSCQHCIMELKKQLSKLEVIVKNVQIGSAEIEYDDKVVSNSQIQEAVNEAGFLLKANPVVK